MRSGLRMIAKSVGSAPPVPLASPGRYHRMFDLGVGKGSKETLMRTYGMSGTVYAIVSLLQSSPASAKWHLYKKQKEDGRVRYSTPGTGAQGNTPQRTEVVNHAALSLWNKPNAFHSRFEFQEGANQHLELTGETFWVLDNETANFPTSMWYVRPDRLEPVPGADQFIAGWIYYSPDGESIPLTNDQVIQEKTPDPLDSFRGTGPTASILANIEQQNYATQFQRNLFLNGADPGAIIQLDKRLTDREWDEFTERWRESHQGIARAGRVGILENGAQWVAPAGVNNKDMQYTNLRLANRDEIREAWRMHKSMLGTADDVNRANAQTAEEVFTSWMTVPRLERRKDTLNCKFLPLFGASGEGVEFDYDDPTPDNREEDNGALAAQTTAFAALIDAGVDPDDAAEVAGLPSMAMVEKATQMPALPPAWVPAPPAAPAGGDSGTEPDSGDDSTPQARLSYTMYGKSDAAKAYQQEAADYPADAIAWMHHATWTGPVKVPESQIDPDMSALDPADPGHVNEFVKLLHKGRKLKPVILVKRPGSPLLLLVDGHHRYLAAISEGKKVRAFIGTVTKNHGDWETMHEQQSNRHIGNSLRWREPSPYELIGAFMHSSINGHSQVGV